MPARTARYIVRRVPFIVALFVVSVFTIEAGRTAAGWWSEWRVSRIEQVEVFEYFAVEYVETTDDGLLMASTAAWYQWVDRIEWADRLECGGATWSSQFFPREDPREPKPLATVEWPYLSGHPTDGRTCRMVSTIRAEAHGRVFEQRIESAPFIPGGTS